MKKILFSLFIIAGLFTANAKVITAEQAQAIAGKFMATSMHKQVAAGELSLATRGAKRVAGVTQSAPAYYIFNASQSYVIVAGDDRMPAVLGYSDSGAIIPNDMPDGLKDLLECYAVQAASLNGDNDGLPVPSGSIARTPIAPLLPCKWNQGAPFNLSCPLIDGSSRAATGCVATAMAQVMDYWKWPATISQPIPAYTTDTKGIYMPELSVEGFPGWDNVKEYYKWDDNSSAGTEVSKIMLYCGQALEMDYNRSSGASTSRIPSLLAQYFRYSPTGQYISRESYTAEQWASLIYNELAAKRPILYRGSAYNGGGHCYVLDGMDANGLVHINWGWGGQSDGYFLITNLNPDDQGAGSSVSNDGYIVGSAMVIGVSPENKEVTLNGAPMYSTNIELNNTTYTRNSSSQPFTDVLLHCSMYSQYPVPADIDFGMGLYTTSGTLKQVIYSGWFRELKTGWGSTFDWSCEIPASIAEGTYYLKPVSRLHNTGDDWVPSAGADINYWQATITSTKLTIGIVGNGATPSYRVNSVNYNGKKEANRTIEMAANITNTGTNYFRYLYLLVDGTCATLAQCPIEPGQTGDITMHFAAETSGTHSLKLCYDEYGNNVLWQGSITLGTAASASMSFGSISIKNVISDNKINDNKFAFTVKATNNGSSAYNDYVVARLYKRTGENTGNTVTQEVKELSLASRQSQTLSFEFPDLVEGEDYFILIWYYTNGTLTRSSGTGFYTILGSPYDPRDVNQDGVVDIADLNVIVSYILGDTSVDVYHRADVNGDGMIDVTDVNIIVDKILNQ